MTTENQLEQYSNKKDTMREIGHTNHINLRTKFGSHMTSSARVIINSNSHLYLKTLL